MVPPFPGHEQFKGQIAHTARWPREGLDLKGKRVGVIGTGATGIQVIQTIASEVKELKVFQRTAQYAVPSAPVAVLTALPSSCAALVAASDAAWVACPPNA